MAGNKERAMWAAKILHGRASDILDTQPKSLQRLPFKGRIMGVDPSLRGTGVALIDFAAGYGVYVASETLKFSPKATMVECLGLIAGNLTRLAEQFQPDLLAIEETIYVQNFKTAQILGAARGAAIGALAARGLPVFEYSPLRIKQAVSGFGRASKEQVAGQVKGLLKLQEALSFDESDAAAVAICHALTMGRLSIG